VRAKFWAPALLPVFLGGRMTVTPQERARSPVLSVEKSSMTMISSGFTVCAWRLWMVSTTLAASLKAGTMTVKPLLMPWTD
jgi:hypothetical protein